MALATFGEAIPPCLSHEVVSFCIVCGCPHFPVRYENFNVKGFFDHQASAADVQHSLPSPFGIGGMKSLDWYFNASQKELNKFFKETLPKKYYWKPTNVGEWMQPLVIVDPSGHKHCTFLANVNDVRSLVWDNKGERPSIEEVVVTPNSPFVTFRKSNDSSRQTGVVFHQICHKFWQQKFPCTPRWWDAVFCYKSKGNCDYMATEMMNFPPRYFSIYQLLNQAWYFTHPCASKFQWNRYNVAFDNNREETKRTRVKRLCISRLKSSGRTIAAAIEMSLDLVLLSDLLDIADLGNCSQVCNSWYVSCGSPIVWKSCILRHPTFKFVVQECKKTNTYEIDWKRVYMSLLSGRNRELKNYLRIQYQLENLEQRYCL